MMVVVFYVAGYFFEVQQRLRSATDHSALLQLNQMSSIIVYQRGEDMTHSIRYVSLKAHIEDLPKESDFEFHQATFPKLKKGQFIAENHYVSVDPGMLLRLSGKGSYAPPVKPGEMINGFAIGRVLDSRNAGFEEGDMVTMGGGWASHSIFGGVGYAIKLPEIDIPTSLFLGILGIPGMASYFGLKRVGRFQQGDHILVTSAAGPVGATAGQIAKQ